MVECVNMVIKNGSQYVGITAKWPMLSLEMLPEIYGPRLKKSEGPENLVQIE